MKKSMLKTPGGLLALCVILLCNLTLVSADSIEGEWIKSSGEVMIDVKVVDGKLTGTLQTWKSKKGRTTDANNPDKRLRSRPLKGLTVLWGVEKKGDSWQGGYVYNASDGKTYRVKLTQVSKDEIAVRAFVGARLFGKTVKWKRK